MLYRHVLDKMDMGLVLSLVIVLLGVGIGFVFVTISCSLTKAISVTGATITAVQGELKSEPKLSIVQQKRLERFQPKTTRPRTKKLTTLIEVPLTEGPGRYLPAPVGPKSSLPTATRNRAQVYFPCKAMAAKATTVAVEIDNEAARRWLSKSTAEYLSGGSKFLSQYLKGYDYPVISLELHYNDQIYLNFEVVDTAVGAVGGIKQTQLPTIYLSRYD